ncbi:MAG: caspase family protein [bacterium]|nr:caspase family protein [bacterium]
MHALLIGINHYPNLNARMQLDGCLNDVQAMAHVLEAQFGFPAERITVLQDEEATQAGIRTAMDALLRRARKDDVVVVHYSGHGSKMRDREGTEPDGWDETIVPYDSGRRPHPNRDISDDEIYAWLLKLSDVTPYVTLIFDSCFSGSIARDAFAAKVRCLEPDPRPVEELPPSPVGVRGARREKGSSGWLPLSRRYVLFAGCRDHESSQELKGETPHGALSFFLCRELTRTAAATTWRDLFERVSREVTAAFPSQHPQLEGARDRELFGVRSLAPMRFIPVRERVGDRIILGGGLAHGLSAGSQWAIYPQGTRRLSATPRQGLVRISAARAVTAEAEILEEAEKGSIESGSRAVEHAHHEGEERLAVEVRGEAGARERVAELKEGIAGSGLLRLAAMGEAGELRIYAVAPRKRAEAEDPVPQLGALNEPAWAAVGHDGELVMPIHPVDGAGVVDQLLVDLEHLARYRRVLALENRDPESHLRGRIEVVLKRRRPGESWEVAEPQEGAGEIVFEEGDRLALEITNHHQAPIYLGVLDFGLTWRIGLVYPVEGANEALAPNRTLEIGVREGEELPLFIPEGFPFGKPSRSQAAVGGTESVKIIATTHEADFSALAQEPLLAIPRRTDEDWTTVTRSFFLRRRSRLETTG